MSEICTIFFKCLLTLRKDDPDDNAGDEPVYIGPKATDIEKLAVPHVFVPFGNDYVGWNKVEEGASEQHEEPVESTITDC
jgi:hypothetical protein